MSCGPCLRYPHYCLGDDLVKNNLAIANCRVSSDEQLKSNSLNRQREAVLNASKRLDAIIPSDGWWSGSVSSKRGNNIARKDIREMMEYCKKHKSVKYLIVDEPDRFMRSIDEAIYFEMEFKLIGVRVWYASDNDLNSDNMQAKLMKFMKYFVAEGSNEERQKKSIDGQSKALREGRYTFHPKPGYMKGSVSGVHIIHPDRGPALRQVLKRLAAGLVSPTNALIELNKTPFTKNNALYKMDKFRKIATDPYYAGIVTINKQVSVMNQNGLHVPLITLKEHRRLIEIMDGKPKYQVGPKRMGNPMFPLSNLVEDDTCLDLKDKGRLVGVPLTNGKSPKIYKKYRCRSCRHSWNLDVMHDKIADLFQQYEMSEENQSKIIEALDIVWRKDGEQRSANITATSRSIVELKSVIKKQVESLVDPSNAPYKTELAEIIEEKKVKLAMLEKELERLVDSEEDDRREFMEFALSFIQDTGSHFLDPYVSKENRLRCKQMLFPGGIMIKEKEKVYTPELSVFYRGVAIKKDTEVSDKVHLVRVRRL